MSHVFSDIWSELDHLFVEVLSGTPQVVESTRISTPWRRERPEGWFSFSLVPVSDDSGDVCGFTASMFETTVVHEAQRRQRHSEERQVFLLRLSDALRPLSDPVAVQRIACEVLGEHLQADRVVYAIVHPDDVHVDMAENYVASDVMSLTGRLKMADFGEEFLARLRLGRSVVVPNIASSDLLSEQERSAYGAIGIAAIVCSPLIKSGRFVANLNVHHNVPRDWTEAEVDLVAATAERTWEAIERGRADSALRRSEAKYRFLFDNLERTQSALRKSDRYFKALVTAGTYSIYRMSPDWKLMYQLDSDTLEDTSAPIEDWVDKYIPAQDQELVFAAIEEAVRTKSLFELEHRVRTADGGIGWVVSRAVPLLDNGGEIIEWFGAGTVVTERREAFEKLRQTEDDYRASLERQVHQRTQELEANRDHLQAILDCSRDMIQVFEAVRDRSGQIVDFNWVLNNHTSESFYGPILGQSLLERNPGVVAEGIYDAFKRVAETGVPEQAEHHYVHEQFDGWFYQSVVKLGDGVATTTKEISDWKNAQAKVARLERQVINARLRESEARSQGLVEGLAQAFWEADAVGRVVADSPSWRTYTGQSFEEWKDYGWLDAIHPEDREFAERQWREATSEGRMVDAEFRLRHSASNSWRWTNVRAVPLLDENGTTEKWVGMNLDIHDRKVAEDAVRESEERLQSATQVGRLGLWDWNVVTGEVHWSDEHYRMEGYVPREITPSYQAWFDRVHPEDRAETEGALRHAMENREEYVHEFRVVHPDGSVHWLYGRGRFFYAATGHPIRMIGAMMDVTVRREWEDRQAVLVAELQHRTRNLIAAVPSMADKTTRSSADLSDFQERFRDRLGALARVQGLLSRLNEHDRVDFDDLVRSELDALHADPDRTTISGPRGVRLRSSTVQTLAMALHELATNAVKYGALGQAHAHLSVQWSFEPASVGEKPMLHIDWHESGVTMPTQKSLQGGGQGRELIERALPYQLRAQVKYELGNDGVRCRIALPVSLTHETGEH